MPGLRKQISKAIRCILSETGKGQLILKCLFGIFNYFQKQTEKFDLTKLWYLNSNRVHLFFGRIEDTKDTFRN